MFVAMIVGILSSLMFVCPQLVMKLSCSFSRMLGQAEIKILLPGRSGKN